MWCIFKIFFYSFLRHSTSVECLSVIALRSPSALANQNVSMELISQSRSDFSVNQFTPTSCMCLYTRWDTNTRSQNSSEIEVKFIAVQWGESSENISVSYIYVDFYERFPSDGCMPSSLRPERIVRSNIRLRKKATRNLGLPALSVRLCILTALVVIASQGSR